jgi:molybdopterin-containing oxidoreductase family membrane subunit
MLGILRYIVKETINGNKYYILWVLSLVTLMLIGLYCYAKQLAFGLYVTGMGDEVSWGFYIANFVYLVGMAAAAVMMVIPAYLFKDKDMHKVVIFAELFAIAALIMCLLFITIDLGRPDRLWHLIPGIGRFNWPSSMLTWDVLVLNGYLLINLFVCWHYLSRKYRGLEVKTRFYLFVVFLSIIWAPSIHTVTGFLFESLVGRSFWHSGLIAPRFLASAFSAGPAFMILVFLVLKKFKAMDISDSAINRIRIIVTISLIINLILMGSEIFAELYHPTAHSVHISFLLGLHGKSLLTPWIWLAIFLVLSALFIFVTPLRFKTPFLIAGSLFVVFGIWLEKGLGFLIPGFIPSTIGDFIQYIPTANEVFIVTGVWATGLLIYTLLLKIALPIINSEKD